MDGRGVGRRRGSPAGSALVLHPPIMEGPTMAAPADPPLAHGSNPCGGIGQAVSIQSYIRNCDGLEIKIDDECFFERHEDGILEEGVVVDLLKYEDRVEAVVRYKDKTWARHSAYNERIDAEALQTRDLVLNQGRTRRVTRPVTRFVPKIDSGASKGGKGHRKGEEDRKKKKKQKKRRSRWGGEDGKVRRERKLRRRVKKLLLAGELDVDSLPRATDEKEGDRKGASIECMEADKENIGREGEGWVATAGGAKDAKQEAAQLSAKITLALSRLGLSDGPQALNIPEGLELADVSTSSDDASSVCSWSSSSFSPSSSDLDSDSDDDSDDDLSDVSTDSCPSEPDYKYWNTICEPNKGQKKEVGFDVYQICPKCDNSDSDSDEEANEQGLRHSIQTGWSFHEKQALLKEYLARPASLERRRTVGAIAYKEWCLGLHLVSQEVGGLDHLETCREIKGVKRCEGTRTMYGAIRSPLIKEMIRFMGVTKEDRFIDIGSGIGTVVLQMASTTGCTATGIELEESRHMLSTVLFDDMMRMLKDMGAGADFVQELRGRIQMIKGDIRLHEAKILSSTAIYFNNHGVWFDETASKEGEISVEHWVAKIFAKTAIGTRLVILKSIPHLKGDWFKEEVYIARHDWLTWARDEKPLFCYTKLKNTWMCEKCLCENEIVREDQGLWEMKCINNCSSRAQTLRTKKAMNE